METRRRIGLVGLVALSLILGVVALPSWASAQTSQQVSITLSEFAIAPAQITVPLGQPVTFNVSNTGKFPHNFTVELSSKSIEQKLFDTNLSPGETRTAQYTFSAAGQWTMYCPVPGHEAKGMTGTIMVEQVSASAAPGMPKTGGGTEQLWLTLASLVALGLAGAGLSARRWARSRR